MKIWEKLTEGLSKKSNLMIAIASIALLISLVFVYLFPNSIAILVACIACGVLNMIQSYKFIRDKRKKSMGMSMLLLGILMIVVGIIIVVS